MNFKSNINSYGAFELKRIYLKNYSFGFAIAIIIHLIVLIILNNILKETSQQIVKEKYEVINYVELGPPPSIIENISQSVPQTSKPTFGNLKPAKKGEETSEFEIPKESNQIGNVKVEESKLTEKKTEAIDETYYVSVDVMPEPFGGFEKLQQNVNYPEEAKKNSIIGKVFVKAFINENGEVTKTELIKGLGFGCDDEAIWLIKNTRFRAGKKNGKPVKVQMVIPITFRP
ncbi:MAG: TonB family protein [Melioribacteraceae bacterium]|nr:TonB family protein [Melioribacteraceae bacterium]